MFIYIYLYNYTVFNTLFLQEQRIEELYSEYCRNKLKSDSLVQKYADTFFKVCIHCIVVFLFFKLII